MTRPRVLLVVDRCNPEWPSEPLEGYRWYEGLRARVDATLVTHVRNRAALQRAGADDSIVYIEESAATRRYYAAARRLATRRGAINWPLLHALSYPSYEAFNQQVYRQFAARVRGGAYDIVHAITPVLPRYPVKLSRACAPSSGLLGAGRRLRGESARVPFVLGPVNGGLPFSAGFAAVARREFGGYYFLRRLGGILPGYRATYQRADVLLAGSQYTADWLCQTFPLRSQHVRLLHENGVSPDFFGSARQQTVSPDRFTLLFVGRLVPFKGCDLLLQAIAGAGEPSLHLIVVGDGPERAALAELSNRLGLRDRVRFVGWIPQHQTADYYRAADAFCFPSIREFGGAVVLEAMAAGLPAIVVDYGGIGEYVTFDTGYKIPAHSPAQLVRDLSAAIRRIALDRGEWQRMSRHAIERARSFEWSRKCEQMTRIYAEARRVT